jgi:hypothetical protein
MHKEEKYAVSHEKAMYKLGKLVRIIYHIEFHFSKYMGLLA